MDDWVSWPMTTHRIHNRLVDKEDSNISKVKLYKASTKEEILEGIDLPYGMLSENEKRGVDQLILEGYPINIAVEQIIGTCKVC